MHGIQAPEVALPTELEEIEPAFAHHGPEDLPTYRISRWPLGSTDRRRGVRRQGGGENPLADVLCPLATEGRCAGQLGAEYPPNVRHSWRQGRAGTRVIQLDAQAIPRETSEAGESICGPAGDKTAGTSDGIIGAFQAA